MQENGVMLDENFSSITFTELKKREVEEEDYTIEQTEIQTAQMNLFSDKVVEQVETVPAVIEAVPVIAPVEQNAQTKPSKASSDKASSEELITKEVWNKFYQEARFKLRLSLPQILEKASEYKGKEVNYLPAEFKTVGKLRAFYKELKTA